MTPQEPQSPNVRKDLKNALGWILAIGFAHIHLPTLLFKIPGTRGSRVDENLGAYLSLIYLPIWWVYVTQAFRPPHQMVHPPVSPPLFLLCWLGIIVLSVIHRIGTARAIRRGALIHSRDIGQSWFHKWSRGRSNGVTGEMIACGLLCFATIPFDMAIAMYFLVATFLMTLPTALIEERRKHEFQEVVDSRLSQQWLADQVRDRFSS